MYRLFQYYLKTLKSHVEHMQDRLLNESNPEQIEAYTEKILALWPLIILGNSILEGCYNENKGECSTGDNAVSGKQISTKDEHTD